MFKTVRYLIKTPWVEIQKDRQDYKTARAERDKRRLALYYARNRITSTFGDEIDEGKVRGCIKHFKEYYMDPEEPQHFFVVERDTYCPNFKPNGARSCGKLDCSFYQANIEHFLADRQHDAAVAALHAFWGKRIAQRLNLNQGNVK